MNDNLLYDALVRWIDNLRCERIATRGARIARLVVRFDEEDGGVAAEGVVQLGTSRKGRAGVS